MSVNYCLLLRPVSGRMIHSELSATQPTESPIVDPVPDSGTTTMPPTVSPATESPTTAPATKSPTLAPASDPPITSPSTASPTIAPVVRTTASPTDPSGNFADTPTTATFVVSWLVSILSPGGLVGNAIPQVTFTCGPGGTAGLVQTSDTDNVFCEPGTTASQLVCDSTSLVLGYRDRLGGNGNLVNATMACTGSTEAALYPTVELTSSPLTARVVGQFSDENIVLARSETHLIVHRVCGSELEFWTSCTPSDFVGGFCLSNGGCNAVCFGVGCVETCEFTAPDIIHRTPAFSATGDLECLAPTVENGGRCFADAMCQSGICANNVCLADQLADTAECTTSLHCQSGLCGIFDTNDSTRNTELGCCPSGSRFSTSEGVYCRIAPAGMPCSCSSGRFCRTCISGVCSFGVCLAGRLDSLEVCDGPETCLSGACGFLATGDTDKVCCPSGRTSGVVTPICT